MAACLLDDVSYVRYELPGGDPDPWAGSYYIIYRGDEKLGYVWKQKCFTYLGTQGWNRGVRIRDFHPIEWVAGLTPFEFIRLSYKTRREAVKRFLEDHAA